MATKKATKKTAKKAAKKAPAAVAPEPTPEPEYLMPTDVARCVHYVPIGQTCNECRYDARHLQRPA